MVFGPKDDGKSAKEEDHREDKPATDWWMFGVTLLLALIGGGQCYIYFHQWKAMNAALAASDETLKHAQQTAVVENRAYVTVEHVQATSDKTVIMDITGDTIFCETNVKNIWTWTAIDAETKLIPCWYVGERDGQAAYHFMHDLAARLAHRVQLTTDGHKPYLGAVEDAFGGDIDYAQLVKIYGEGQPGPHTRYSPGVCMGTRLAAVTGQPDHGHVSTSFVERSNLTLRMGNRRFTRLTNAFSKKVANHEHAVALTFMHYNFCRIHQTLRVTPAMQAGIASRVWELSDIVALLDSPEDQKAA